MLLSAKLVLNFLKACILDSGYVEFEVIGKDNYLKEKSHNRGIYATSVDAMMLAENKMAAKYLFALNGSSQNSIKVILWQPGNQV